MSDFSLYHYIKPYKLFIVGIFLTIIISSLSILSLGQGLRYVIDHGFFLKEGGTASLATIFNTFLLIIIIISSAIFARICLISYSGERVIANIRIDAYNHLLSLPQRFFEEIKIGEVLSTLISDTAALQLIISGALSNALRNGAMLIGSMAMLLYTSVKLSCYSFLIIPPIILTISIMGKKVKRLSKKARDSIAKIASYSEETLNGIKTIQTFTYEQQASDNFTERAINTLKCFVKYEYTRAILVVLIIVTVLSSIGLVIFIGSNDVISGTMTSGELSAFIFYCVFAANSVSRLGEIFSELQQSGAAIQRLNELFKKKNTSLVETKNPLPTPDNITEIAFNKVSFNYQIENNTPTLQDISFTVKGGEKIAIVGPSGAGKSTILDLIMRFYDVKSGMITINGINIREFTLQNLRQLITMVPQDSTIFSTTIAKNIAYAKVNATLDEISQAAKDAHAIEFIEQLPNNFEAFVGEKGIKLSGGQKQRLSIARAILRKAKVLLLDEATSALDTENELLIQKSLQNLDKNITTITIAHRLSTVMNADKIIVIEQGKIIEIGTHDSLLAQNGLYYKLINLQRIK